ncbi:MAG: alpha/beta hydrolase [Pseudomonadota bacterium]
MSDGGVSACGIPAWFSQALAVTPRQRTVLVRDCPINYLSWGDAARPPLLLVHGGLAHAMWWSALAPQLARDYFIIAPDLSGHGDSGRREPYSLESWADDVMAVCADADLGAAPVLVGHSLGGQIGIVAGARYGAQLAGVVIVDAPVSKPDPESRPSQRVAPLHSYPDLASGMARFRLIPEQPCENGFFLDHIARHSLRRHAAGWSWKFDPRIMARVMPVSLDRDLAAMRCRVAMMRGELSAIVPPEIGDYMYELLERSAPLVEIPQAGHHLMVDQPLAFLAALRAILAGWEHSLPRQRQVKS